MADLKTPPHSKTAEESVLGSVLIDKDAIIAIADFLKPEHFYDARNELIFKAVLELYEERSPIDIVTLTEKIKKSKVKTAEYSVYLADLVNNLPTSANVEKYGQIIKGYYTKRQLISAAAKISEAAFDDGTDTEKALDQSESLIFSLSQKHLKQSFVALKDILVESFDRLDELHKTAGGLRGISSGYRELDNLLAGFQDSNLIIVAARPGIGKTAFGLNILRHVAVDLKISAGIFSVEMSSEELSDRLLVRQADIDAWKLKTGKMEDEDYERYSEAMGILADAPLYIDDTPGISINEMRTKARRLQIESGLHLIVADYLQLIKGRNLENRVQEVSEVSMGLKNIARELKIPVIAMAQLSRAVETRGGARPKLADLRESGSIEQDADVVMFLYREDEENPENVTLEIAKHRNGPTGVIKLRFVPNRVSFYSVDTKRKEA